MRWWGKELGRHEIGVVYRLLGLMDWSRCLGEIDGMGWMLWVSVCLCVLLMTGRRTAVDTVDGEWETGLSLLACVLFPRYCFLLLSSDIHSTTVLLPRSAHKLSSINEHNTLLFWNLKLPHAAVGDTLMVERSRESWRWKMRELLLKRVLLYLLHVRLATTRCMPGPVLFYYADIYCISWTWSDGN